MAKRNSVKMKGRNIIIGLVAIGSMLSACDKVEYPILPTVTSTLTVRQQSVLDSIESRFPAPTNVQRVLIEDFTGQYCGNCPSAARKADSLYRAHPTQVIVMEEHVTDYYSMPRPPDFPLDFRPAVSAQIAQTYDFDNRGLPQGAVNRSPFISAGNDVVATYALWPGVVNSQLALTPEQELRLTPHYDPATRILQLKIATHYLTAQSAAFRLGIAIIEDSLVGTQKDYRAPAGVQQSAGQETHNYVHRNVMRAVLNGTFGTEQVKSAIIGQQVNTYISYMLPAAWVAKNCGIVAYLAKEVNGPIAQTTGQISQVAMVKIVQ